MRRAVATRLRTRRLLVKSTLPPLTFFSGQSPSQDAKAEAFRNRETSVPISHRLSCDCADSGHIRQIHSEDAIQLPTKVKCLWLISTPLICRSLCSCGCCLLCCCRCLKVAQLELNLLVNFKNEILIVAIGRQRLTKCE